MNEGPRVIAGVEPPRCEKRGSGYVVIVDSADGYVEVPAESPSGIVAIINERSLHFRALSVNDEVLVRPIGDSAMEDAHRALKGVLDRCDVELDDLRDALRPRVEVSGRPRCVVKGCTEYAVRGSSRCSPCAKERDARRYGLGVGKAPDVARERRERAVRDRRRTKRRAKAKAARKARKGQR